MRRELVLRLSSLRERRRLSIRQNGRKEDFAVFRLFLYSSFILQFKKHMSFLWFGQYRLSCQFTYNFFVEWDGVKGTEWRC
jgi:hypothetical protein